jgi:sulfite reductase (NADPH) flavoprotein alpha-component
MQLPPVDPTTSPLSPEQAAGVNQLVASLTPVQVAWLGGYLTGVAGYTQSLLGLLQPGAPGTLPAMAQAAPAGALEITVLFGSQTGNSEKVARKVVKLAATKGIKATAKDMGQYRLAAEAGEAPAGGRQYPR